jgi:predicted ArsR family transcriptional regulator
VVNLEQEQRDILQTLRSKGAMTPIEISVTTMIEPDRVLKYLDELRSREYVVLRYTKGGIEDQMVMLSDRGMKALL